MEEINYGAFTIIDADGTERHKLSMRDLLNLYGDLHRFIKDCTIEERKRFHDDFNGILGLLNQRLYILKNMAQDESR